MGLMSQALMLPEEQVQPGPCELRSRLIFCCYESQLVTETCPSNTLLHLYISTHSKSPRYFSMLLWTGVEAPLHGCWASFVSAGTLPARYPLDAGAISTNFFNRNTAVRMSPAKKLSHPEKTFEDLHFWLDLLSTWNLPSRGGFEMVQVTISKAYLLCNLLLGSCFS